MKNIQQPETTCGYMKILIIFPNFESRQGDFHTGIASISAVLKQEGHKINLIQLKRPDKPIWKDLVRERIKLFKPGLIAFSLTELYAPFYRECSDLIRKEFGLPIMAGGSYPSLMPKEVLEHSDYVVTGECEEVINKVVGNIENGKSVKDIMSVWTIEKGKLYGNQTAPVPDVNTLPFPDRSIFDTESICRGSMDVMCSRGCPFGCTYCINRHIMKIYPNKANYVRFRKVDSIIEEMKMLQEQYKFDTITLPDDTVLLDLSWIKEFAPAYKKEIDLPFHANARPETCREELVKEFAAAGCSLIRIGVESGNEQLRRRVLDRQTTDQQIIDAFVTTKKYGIETYAFNMIGLPFETKLNMFETLMLNVKIQPDVVQVSAFYPFRGTGLGNISYEKGWVMTEKIEQLESYFEESVMDYPQLKNADINYFNNNFLMWYLLKTRKYKKYINQKGRRMFRRLPENMQEALIKKVGILA